LSDSQKLSLFSILNWWQATILTVSAHQPTITIDWAVE
jgi:hypothetical protein